MVYCVAKTRREIHMTEAKTTDDDVEKKIAELKAEIEALRGTVNDLRKAGYERVKGRIEGEVEGLRQSASEKADRVRREVEERVRGVESSVKENPMTSVLGAFVVGFIVASLLRR
jgi:ElaB/YqjD/DUF883 family membrane-anchored ribosome-binding protein